jgi:predicted homoserine dehydrogenase-like protein
MVTNFTDGTKLCLEQAVIANATGFRVGRRGMYGPSCEHVSEAQDLFVLDELLEQPLVDYVLGAEPGPGVFVLGYDDRQTRRQYMHHYKMGKGPLYTFYTPCHLPHLEAPLTAARAVLFRDATIAPLGAPVCDVVTVAKRDLNEGEVLDGIGGFTCYGLIDNVNTARLEGLVPISLAEGCRLKHPVPRGRAIRHVDVEMPPDALARGLRREQDEHFFGASLLPTESPRRVGVGKQ